MDPASPRHRVEDGGRGIGPVAVPWDAPEVERLLDAAVAEDLGAGDITSDAVLPAGARARARIMAQAPLVIAGGPLVPRCYARLRGAVAITVHVTDGTSVAAGTAVVELRGDARTILTGERTVLNLLQHLSGIATLTRRCVATLADTRCIVRDTRKTLPGLRLLEKYAVRIGGGTNHRLRLDDGVLIKDNHVALAGGVGAAVAAARRVLPLNRIEVECDTLAEVDAALTAGADAILLDNMNPVEMTRAVKLVGGRVPVEASGGVTPERLREVAATGVDFVAMGCLTHSAPAADLGMSVEPLEE
jgi:nicotinate-nucleotide pyrophosphorylase (carboxylating)